MMRGASELQKRASLIEVSAIQSSSDNRRPIDLLEWIVEPSDLLRAKKDLQQVLDHQQATFILSGIGRKAFQAQKMEPVPTFILALGMAVKYFSGRVGNISQFLTMSKYRCMDMNITNVTTPEVIQFVNYMDGNDLQPDMTRILYQNAVDSQLKECRKGRKYLPLTTSFLLFYNSLSGYRKKLIALIVALMVFCLWVSRLFKPTVNDIIVSHPEIYEEITIVGRPGIRLPYVKYFGLHYQILDDRMVITMMPGQKWPVKNQDFILHVEKNLKKIISSLQ
jgi:hypothetical protein